MRSSPQIKPLLSSPRVSGEELAAHGDFAGRSGKCALRGGLITATYFNNHVARANRGNPAFWIAFALTHAGLKRLLGNWLVREHTNPQLSAPLHVTRGGHTGCLNLVSGQPASRQRLEAELAKVQLVIAACVAPEDAALNLAVFYAFWH